MRLWLRKHLKNQRVTMELGLELPLLARKRAVTHCTPQPPVTPSLVPRMRPTAPLLCPQGVLGAGA